MSDIVDIESLDSKSIADRELTPEQAEIARKAVAHVDQVRLVRAIQQDPHLKNQKTEREIKTQEWMEYNRSRQEKSEKEEKVLVGASSDNS